MPLLFYYLDREKGAMNIFLKIEGSKITQDADGNPMLNEDVETFWIKAAPDEELKRLIIRKYCPAFYVKNKWRWEEGDGVVFHENHKAGSLAEHVRSVLAGERDLSWLEGRHVVFVLIKGGRTRIGRTLEASLNI